MYREDLSMQVLDNVNNTWPLNVIKGILIKLYVIIA